MNEIFNPYDINTFQYANSEKLLIVDGAPLYNIKFVNNQITREYLYQTDIFELTKPSKYFDSKPITNKDLETFYFRFQECINKPVLLSSDIYDGYTFTFAQLELIKHFTPEQKLKLAQLINNHFINKNEKYKLKQEIYYNFNIDSDFFTVLCYAKTVQKEQEIIFKYMTQLIVYDDINEVINSNLYFHIYPDFKNKILEQINKKD